MSATHRRETAADDEERTWRLMQGVEDTYVVRTLDLPDDDVAGRALTDFEAVLSGGITSIGDPYPPAGHTYPRKDGPDGCDVTPYGLWPPTDVP